MRGADSVKRISGASRGETRMSDYGSLEIDVEEAVATIEIKSFEDWDGGELHWDLADALGELRSNLDVRVVVLTSWYDDFFYRASPPENFPGADAGDFSEKDFERVVDPYGSYKTFNGIIRTHQTLVEMEKPVIAKVNGDAKGFGTSVIFGCDFIVTTEDAELVDVHMDMGETEDDGRRYGMEWGVPPGDGGAALLPLYMSPTLAKEVLLLGKSLTGADLYDRGMINDAVPADELDETVAEYVDRLLDRSSFALAWSKRVANRQMADQLNRVLDAAAAYENLALTQRAIVDEDPRSLR
jgi:enoyl-CoA hydratase/carnithine racemase